MKKSLFLGFIALLITSVLIGQQIQNPGFEEWEDAGTVIDEPVNWSSIKTSDAGDFVNNAAPVVWGQSDDAHSGNYSIELTNVAAFSIVATGTITNGRIHAAFIPGDAYAFTDPENEQWHTAFTSHPDSVSIWAKYMPQGNDIAQVKIMLHTGDGNLPITPENEANQVGYAQIDITGNVDTWTQFKAPFIWYNQNTPEYMLVVITAGNGTESIEGSKVWYDDIELIYDPAAIDDISDNQGLIHVLDNTIFLNRLLPQNQLNSSMLEIIHLDGSIVYSSEVTSDQIYVKNSHIKNGIYLVRIFGRDINYTQKIYFE